MYCLRINGDLGRSGQVERYCKKGHYQIFLCHLYGRRDSGRSCSLEECLEINGCYRAFLCLDSLSLALDPILITNNFDESFDHLLIHCGVVRNV